MIRGAFRILASARSRGLQLLAALRERRSALMAERRALQGQQKARPRVAEAQPAITSAIDEIGRMVDATKAGFERLEASRRAKGDWFRLLQATYKAFRTPKMPDWSTTLLVIMVFWLLEGSMAGAVLLSDGRMDGPSAITYGLLFALVNIILGVLIGYLALRHIGYRAPIDLTGEEDGEQTPRSVLIIRTTAAVGLLVGLAVEAVLIYGAARLRATGSHHGLTDFSEVGFLETFDDSLAIIIVVIGTCSVILAILKGYSGISDPIPGFSDAYKTATADMDTAGEDWAEDAEEAVERFCETVLGRAEDTLADAEHGPDEAEAAYAALAEDIDHFNDDVTAAKEAVVAVGQRNRGLVAFVTGQAAKRPEPVDVAAFDALLLPGLDDEMAELRSTHIADLAPLEGAMAELEATRDRAFSEIRPALAAFQANTPNLDALFDEGDDHAETQKQITSRQEQTL
ncbi:MAG: hypothetical protein AAGJ28_00405 [Pseudomonadota bacterium]